jgi:hypothetical protein
MTAEQIPAQEVCPARRPGVVLVVWGVWALLVLAALFFIKRYGSNIPVLDEWALVPAVTGDQPLTGEWLWRQWFEHRLPLPRLLYVGLVRAAGYRFRAGTLYSVLALAALAAAMIATARRLRGRLHWADAFFPLLWLHWGQAHNLLESIQVSFITSTCLVGVVLLLTVRGPGLPSLRSAVAVGVCLLLLCLCGMHGLVFVPLGAAWLAYVGVQRWRASQVAGRLDGLLVLALAAAAFALVGLYFVGYQRPPYVPASPGLQASLRSALLFLGMSLGQSATLFWPYSGLLVLGLWLLAVAVAAHAGWRGRPEYRPAALGLALLLVTLGALAAGLGQARAGYGPTQGPWTTWASLAYSRYVTLAAPLLCAVYFLGPATGRPVLGRVLQAGLCVGLAALVLPNAWEGLHFGRWRAAQRNAMEYDLRAGLPVSIIVERHREAICPGGLAEFLGQLRRAGIAPFKYAGDDVPLREVALPVVPTECYHTAWDAGAGQAYGDRPHVEFALDRPRFVYGIRLRYTVSDLPAPTAGTRVSWRGRAADDFADTARTWLFEGPAGREQTRTVWPCQELAGLRFEPDGGPCGYRIAEIVLLVPAGDVPPTAPGPPGG